MIYKTERERLLFEVGFNWTNDCKKKGSEEMNKCYESYWICLECWLNSEMGGKNETNALR